MTLLKLWATNESERADQSLSSVVQLLNPIDSCIAHSKNKLLVWMDGCICWWSQQSLLKLKESVIFSVLVQPRMIEVRVEVVEAWSKADRVWGSYCVRRRCDTLRETAAVHITILITTGFVCIAFYPLNVTNGYTQFDWGTGARDHTRAATLAISTLGLFLLPRTCPGRSCDGVIPNTRHAFPLFHKTDDCFEGSIQREKKKSSRQTLSMVYIYLNFICLKGVHS